jgi:hypothetical protein
MPDSKQIQQIVEAAGAIFVGIQKGHPHGEIVLFQAGPAQTTRALFAFACKEPRDVRLVLGSIR